MVARHGGVIGADRTVELALRRLEHGALAAAQPSDGSAEAASPPSRRAPGENEAVAASAALPARAPSASEGDEG